MVAYPYNIFYSCHRFSYGIFPASIIHCMSLYTHIHMCLCVCGGLIHFLLAHIYEIIKEPEVCFPLQEKWPSKSWGWVRSKKSETEWPGTGQMHFTWRAFDQAPPHTRIYSLRAELFAYEVSQVQRGEWLINSEVERVQNGMRSMEVTMAASIWILITGLENNCKENGKNI